jgi:adenosine deaminase
VAGWPESSLEPLAPVLRRLGERGGLEIHAGEWAGAESVREALELGADRIGHGVTAFDDPAVIEQLVDRGIHLELCLTSNLKTGAIRSLEAHPLRRAHELGISYSINTDDPGPCECSLESELALAVQQAELGATDLQAIARNALAARFGRELRIDLPPELAGPSAPALEPGRKTEFEDGN